MIGLNERTWSRYEVQIQRLLRRADAHQRRIVCLSAILPDGDQLDDSSPPGCAAIIRAGLSEKTGGRLACASVRSCGRRRPPGSTFGSATSGRGSNVFLIGSAPPYWIPPKHRRTRLFPSNHANFVSRLLGGLSMTARLSLSSAPSGVASSRSPMSLSIYMSAALCARCSRPIRTSLRTAIALGEEWLGSDSAILKCLRLGVALHHGALPTAYRKEVERLLRENVLKLTISSPRWPRASTLSATAVVMYSLHRAGERIEISEFKNVIGPGGTSLCRRRGRCPFFQFRRHPQEAMELGSAHHRPRRARDGKRSGAFGRGAAEADARAYRRRP